MAHCRVMGQSTVSCAKMAEPSDMLFWMKTRDGPPTEPCISWGCRSLREGAIFGGCSGHSKALAIFAAPFTAASMQSAAEGIIQYARQAQIVFRQFLGAGNVAYQLRRGWWDCTAWVKSDIYDCLVLTAYCWQKQKYGFDLHCISDGH